jgi:hypothetical protein
MKRGLQLEDPIRKLLKCKYGLVQKCGIYLSKDYPIFGASPDGINATHIFEIKCPSKAKTVKNYVSANSTLKPKVLAQMHLQMKLSNKNKGILIVAAPDFEDSNQYNTYEVQFNESYFQNLIQKATEFWKKAIFPKIPGPADLEIKN